MTSGLTPRMAECLAAIRRLTKDGVSPSISELQAELGDAARGSLHATLCELKDRGAIDWTPKARRSLVIIERPSREALAKLDEETLMAVAHDIMDIVHRKRVARLTGKQPQESAA